MTIIILTNKILLNLRAGLLMTGLVLAYPAQSVLIYNITDLGRPNELYSSGNAINSFGQVTGFSELADGCRHAFITVINGQINDLDTQGGCDSEGYGINDSGQVTGSIGTINGTHAFITNSSGEMTDLGTLDGISSKGYGINASGLVTGYSFRNTKPITKHAFITNISGEMTDLGTLGGGDSVGFGINDSGQVTGYSEFKLHNVRRHAFITNPGGQMTDLGTLGGGDSTGLDINDSGQVTGSSNPNNIDSYEHAFITDPSGQMTDLGKLAGTNISIGSGINNIGQVVGESGYRGFVTHDGKMQDLNSLIPFSASGWFISNASGINDAGQIAGTGYFNGKPRAILLSPTISPPPETITTIMPILPNDSVKLTETLVTKCLNGTCDQSTTGNYSFTLKLSKATLQTAGIDFSKLSANDILSISLGDFSFSGALSDDRKYQLKSNKIKASWIASHVVCTKFDTTQKSFRQMNDCKKSKLVNDTKVSLSGDKKGLTFILSGNNARIHEYLVGQNINQFGFGRYLLTGLCERWGWGLGKTMPVDISIQLGGHAMIGKLTADCQHTRATSKNRKLNAYVWWL